MEAGALHSDETRRRENLPDLGEVQGSPQVGENRIGVLRDETEIHGPRCLRQLAERANATCQALG